MFLPRSTFDELLVKVVKHQILIVNLHSIRFSSASPRVFTKKFVRFRPHFRMFIPALNKLSHTGKNFPKKKCL